MRLTRDGRFERTDLWREGKWIDLWSIVHFLSGMSTAYGLAALHFGFLASSVIAFLAFTAYELWEAMVKIEETPQNRFMDVVVGMVSFVPMFYLLQDSTEQNLLLGFSVVFIANVVLATIGWMASRKAEEFEKRLRAEIAGRRRALKVQRDRLRAKLKQGVHTSDV